MTRWDPSLYLQFGDERTQAAVDLALKVALATPHRVIDIGCGPGNSTAVLRRRWPTAIVEGLDSSPEMIERAKHDAPEGQWLCADATTFAPAEPYDVVYSNAVLQWIPNQRETVLRLWDAVALGGALAVQVPANHESPLHRAVLAATQSELFRPYLQDVSRKPQYLPPGFYYDLLAPKSRRYETWVTEYLHIMQSHEDLITWYKATGMRPFLEALPDDEHRARFQVIVLESIRGAYSMQSDGHLLFPFRRLFFVAYR